MIGWMIGITAVGGLLLLLSAAGSDIGIDFGMAGGGSFLTGALGAFMGIGGGAGLITLGLGLPFFTTVGIAGLSGMAASAIVIKIMSWMLKHSSNGEEQSQARSIGIIGRSTDHVDPGEIGSMMIDLGSGSQRMFFVSQDPVDGDQEVIVSSYDHKRNMMIVRAVSGGTTSRRSKNDPINMDAVVNDLAHREELDETSSADETAGGSTVDHHVDSLPSR